jgi:hypothetical protein
MSHISPYELKYRNYILMKLSVTISLTRAASKLKLCVQDGKIYLLEILC